MKAANDTSIRNFSLASLTVFALVLSGCSTTSKITPVPLHHYDDPCNVLNGIVFSLPKTILEIKIIYSVSGNEFSQKAVVERPIEVITKTIPDSRMRFLFDTESHNGFFKDANITIETSETGLIKSTNMVVTDKTKKAVQDFTQTAFNVAKFIAEVSRGKKIEMLKIEEEAMDVNVIRHIDPATLDFKLEKDYYVATYSDFEEIKQAIPNLDGANTSKVVVKIISDTDLAKSSKILSTDLKIDGQKIKQLTGIPYRIPGLVKVLICVDKQQVYDGYFMLSQAGGIAFIPLKTKCFTDITQGLTFFDETAVLKRFTSTGTSMAEGASATTKETTVLVVKEVNDLER